MLVNWYYMLRQAGLPTSVTEYLTLLEALDARLGALSVDEFYYLARSALVKDEGLFDRFDQVFAAHFQGAEALFDKLVGDVPEEWLRLQQELFLTEEEKAKIDSLGGWEALMEALKDRLEEQEDRHQGGSKWIGTGGT